MLCEFYFIRYFACDSLVFFFFSTPQARSDKPLFSSNHELDSLVSVHYFLYILILLVNLISTFLFFPFGVCFDAYLSLLFTIKNLFTHGSVCGKRSIKKNTTSSFSQWDCPSKYTHSLKSQHVREKKTEITFQKYVS